MPKFKPHHVSIFELMGAIISMHPQSSPPTTRPPQSIANAISGKHLSCTSITMPIHQYPQQLPPQVSSSIPQFSLYLFPDLSDRSTLNHYHHQQAAPPHNLHYLPKVCKTDPSHLFWSISNQTSVELSLFTGSVQDSGRSDPIESEPRAEVPSFTWSNLVWVSSRSSHN